MTKKIDPMKTPPPVARDPLEAEVYGIMDQIQALIVKHPQNAKKIVYALLGNAIACADTIGIDVVQFERDLRAQYVKHPPLVFRDDKGWSPES